MSVLGTLGKIILWVRVVEGEKGVRKLVVEGKGYRKLEIRATKIGEFCSVLFFFFLFFFTLTLTLTLNFVFLVI